MKKRCLSDWICVKPEIVVWILHMACSNVNYSSSPYEPKFANWTLLQILEWIYQAAGLQVSLEDNKILIVIIL